MPKPVRIKNVAEGQQAVRRGADGELEHSTFEVDLGGCEHPGKATVSGSCKVNLGNGEDASVFVALSMPHPPTAAEQERTYRFLSARVKAFIEQELEQHKA